VLTEKVLFTQVPQTKLELQVAQFGSLHRAHVPLM